MTNTLEIMKAKLLQIKEKPTFSQQTPESTKLQELAYKCAETKRNQEVSELKLQLEQKNNHIESLQSEVELWKSAAHQLQEKIGELDSIWIQIESTKAGMESIFQTCNQ